MAPARGRSSGSSALRAFLAKRSAIAQEFSFSLAHRLPMIPPIHMRILIATVTAGAGHLQAAAALEEAWRGLRPGDVVEKVDLLDYVSRLQRRVYVQGYVKLVEHAPELWGMVFKKTDNPA